MKRNHGAPFVWREPDQWLMILDPLARGDDQLAGLHANTHIPQARSWVTASEAMDDPRLMPAARFFFDQVSRRRSFAFGGNGFDEKFEAPGVESRRCDDLTGETCNTHNMLQFSRLLFARTGDVRYADFHEHALINHILASIAPEGQTTYHVAAQPGGGTHQRGCNRHPGHHP